MENQDLSKVLPFFYPTLSVTDASDICMGHYKLGKKKFTEYLSTRNEAFKSLIKMVKFNSGENIEEIMKKYPMSKEQKQILRNYFIKLKNTKGLIDRKELENLLYDRVDDFNEIINSKIKSNEWQVNLLIEKMSELDETSHASNEDTIVSGESDELTLDHDQNIYLTGTAQTSTQGITQQIVSIKSDQFKLDNNQNESSLDSTDIKLKREQDFDQDDMNLNKKKQRIAVNRACANYMKSSRPYKKPEIKEFKYFELSGQFDVINDQVIVHIKTSSVKSKPNQIKLKKNDKVKILLYMLLSGLNKCKCVRIGQSNEEKAEYYDATQFDITTDSLIEKLNEFVESVRSLTKDQFITEYKKFTKV
jgi:hypothetical protein